MIVGLQCYDNKPGYCAIDRRDRHMIMIVGLRCYGNKPGYSATDQRDRDRTVGLLCYRNVSLYEALTS